MGRLELTMAEITSITKTYVLGSDNTTYFEQIVTLYDDESSTTTKTRVGPAAALAADQADKIEAQTRLQAQATYTAQRTKTLLAGIKTTDTTITTLSGSSPLKVIQDRHQAELTASGWTIDEGAGFVPIVFSVNAQGALRYTVNGGSTKNADTYGSIIRLNNYPSNGVNTEFFINENGNRYHALPNRIYVIKTP